MSGELGFTKCGDNEYRAKVIGGWLVKSLEPVPFYFPHREEMHDCYSHNVAMCFVPDANHEWIIK